jgi:hypothetical protein
MVTGLPEIQVELDGVCKGCEKGKNVKHSFPIAIEEPKEFWT